MKEKLIAVATAFYPVVLFAQEEVDVTIAADDEGAWYTSPWVWVLGAAVFILLLVMLTRKNNQNKV